MEGHEPKPSAISAGLKLQCNYNAETDLIFFVNLKNMRKNHLRYLLPIAIWQHNKEHCNSQ